MRLAWGKPRCCCCTAYIFRIEYGIRSLRHSVKAVVRCAWTWYESLLTDLTNPLLCLMSVPAQSKLYAAQLGKYSEAVKPYITTEISAFASDPRRYWAIWQAVTAFESKSRLGRIAVPTLTLVGKKNRQTHVQAKSMARIIPTAAYSGIDNAGHMLTSDQPAAFNAKVSEFIKAHCLE